MKARTSFATSPERNPIRLALILLAAGTAVCQDTPFQPEIPKIWDQRALSDMELPLAAPKFSPKPVSPAYYYKIPIRRIYKSYAIYAPGRAPAG